MASLEYSGTPDDGGWTAADVARTTKAMPTRAEYDAAAARQAAMKIEADKVLRLYERGMLTLEELVAELMMVVA